MSGETDEPIYLAGPTAVGKSAVALELAKQLNGEIISVDSMQVYRGLDIGSAKPSTAEQSLITHHLIDIVDLSETFDAARFIDLARETEADISSRRRFPIYCGGTGLYFKALFHGVSKAPSSDPALRNQLEQTPLPDLLRELAIADPRTFEKIDRDNPRRVVRALEAIRLSGRPFSEQQSDWKSNSLAPKNLFAFSRAAEDQRRRIDVRVEKMISSGLIEETRTLLKNGLHQNRTAMQAIGYRQVVEHLNGHRSLDETIELIKSKTRQFARRQRSWFRNQLRPNWLDLSANSLATETAAAIIDRTKS